MRMARLFGAAVAIAALWTAPGQAQTLKLSDVTCQDFTGSDPATISNLLMWLGGYYMGNNDAAVIDFGKIADQGKQLGDYCHENPTAKLSKAAERIMGSS